MKMVIAFVDGKPQIDTYGNVIVYRSVEEANTLARPLTGAFDIHRAVMAPKATKREKERYAELFGTQTQSRDSDERTN